jgi:hypothetical protein
MAAVRAPAIVAAIAIFGAGCKQATVINAATPQKLLPALDAPPSRPADGTGVVIVDSEDGAATVARITGQSRIRATYTYYNGGFSGVGLTHGSATQTAPVCSTTPCAAYLPYGQHELVFDSNEDEGRRTVFNVTSTEVPSVMRVTLNGQIPASKSYGFGLATMGVGIASSLVGVLLVSGAASHQVPDASGGHSEPVREPVIGGVALGIGGLVLVIGGILFATAEPAHSVVGQSIQWPLEAPPPKPAPAAIPMTARFESLTPASATRRP